MMKLLAFIILVCCLFYSCDCGNLSLIQLAEQTLITTLFTNYNKNVRPDETVYVDITATIQQIVSIDEKLQVMTSSSFISQSWVDDRLSWTPSSSSNIGVVMLPVKSLWIPDTMIVNSADASGYFTISDYSLASVLNTGQVYMILPALTVRTRCATYVQKFPFDKQVCSINITSWSQGSNRIVYTENSSSVIDISQYSEHPLWKLTTTDMIVIHSTDRTPFEDSFNDVISIQLYIQRKPSFFIFNGIFACLILNCVTLLAYAVPYGSQIGLCMVCFMTYSVYSLNFSSLFPQQSDYLMMITLYFLLSIAWTLISMLWFTICNFYATKAELPKALYDFSGFLQRVFFCCFPEPKKDDKKDVIIKNDELKKFENEESTKPTSTQKIKCVSCRKLFASCLKKHNRIDSADKKQHTNTEDADCMKTNSIDVNLCDTTTCVSSTETNEEAKPKCNFCDRCEPCQAEFDKDKAKGKKKKDIEARCSALNYLVLICVLLGMFISDMTVWISMSK